LVATPQPRGFLTSSFLHPPVSPLSRRKSNSTSIVFTGIVINPHPKAMFAEVAPARHARDVRHSPAPGAGLRAPGASPARLPQPVLCRSIVLSSVPCNARLPWTPLRYQSRTGVPCVSRLCSLSARAVNEGLAAAHLLSGVHEKQGCELFGSWDLNRRLG
jgi:hypothetical protein